MTSYINPGTAATVAATPGADIGHIVALTPTRAIALYQVSNTIYARCVSVSGTSISAVSSAVTRSSAGYNDYEVALVRLSDTTALLVHYIVGETALYGTVLTLADTTITFGTAGLLVSGTADAPCVARVSDTRALIAYATGSSPNLHVLTADVVGGVPVPNPTLDLATAPPQSIKVKGVSLSKGMLAWTSIELGFVGVYAKTLTIFSNGVLGNSTTYQVSTANATSLALNIITNTRAYVLYKDTDVSDYAMQPLSMTATSVSAFGSRTLTGLGLDLDLFNNFARITSERAMIAYFTYAGDDTSLAANTLDGNGVLDDSGEVNNLVNPLGQGNVSALSDSLAIVLFSDLDTSLKAVVVNLGATEEEYDGGDGGGDGVPDAEDPILDPGEAWIVGSFPMPVLSASARRLPPQGVIGSFPALTGRIRAGATLGGAFPMPALVARGTTTLSARVAGAFPIPRLVAQATVPLVGRVIGAFPAMRGLVRAGAHASGAFPMPTLVAEASAGILARIVGFFPSPRLVAAASIGHLATVVGEFPRVGIAQHAVVVGAFPMPRLVAAGRVVVAIVYEAYAINLQPSAGYRESAVHEVTRYTGMPFNQVIRYQGRHYGIADTGIYLLGGETDAGAEIPWAWRTAVTNFGSRQQSLVREGFLNGRLGPSVKATVSIGEQADVTYPAVLERGRAGQAHRIKYGRGLKAQYWSFGLESAAGGPCDIDSMLHEPQPISRKV
jgi:hypothetical protein